MDPALTPCRRKYRLNNGGDDGLHDFRCSENQSLAQLITMSDGQGHFFGLAVGVVIGPGCLLGKAEREGAASREAAAVLQHKLTGQQGIADVAQNDLTVTQATIAVGYHRRWGGQVFSQQIPTAETTGVGAMA